ncbi:MAG: efflux RND transporter periplasmic adaptor subunit [Porticoccaceae bacterium]
MQLIKQLCLILMASCLAISPLQAQPDEPQIEARGPHGGILLQKDDITVELQIFEQGVPPEYRAWITRNDRAVTEEIDLNVQLTRLGGQVDRFDFAYQGNYWLGDGVVTEPHSFDVEMTLVVDGKSYRWRWESHEGRTRIAPAIAQKAGITTAAAGPGSIERSLTTYGNLTTAPQQIARVRARFPGIATAVNVNLGDRVERGDVLARVESNESLQTYELRAPIDGIVIERQISNGEIAGEEPLFAIADLSTLWAELKVFPGQRAEVAVGQKVRLRAEGFEREGTILHLLPTASNAPYILARVEVDNAEGILTPGLLVTGDIVVETVAAPLTVDNRALQSFRDWSVVFIQVGDTYEIRPLVQGRSDGQFTEVLAGLQAGDRYVVENSYLIKADIEKSGASHDH